MKKIPKFNKNNKLTEFESSAPWKLYNVSSSRPTKLKLFVKEIEKQLGKKK